MTVAELITALQNLHRPDLDVRTYTVDDQDYYQGAVEGRAGQPHLSSRTIQSSGPDEIYEFVQLTIESYSE